MQLIEVNGVKYIEAANQLIKIDADGNEWILFTPHGDQELLHFWFRLLADKEEIFTREPVTVLEASQARSVGRFLRTEDSSLLTELNDN